MTHRPATALVGAALTLATLVWLSGTDMLLGMLLFVPLGWAVLGACGLVSLVRAGRARTTHAWRRDEAPLWLGCLIGLVASTGLGLAGVPEHLRYVSSRPALVRAGEDVLDGGHPARAGLYGLRTTRVEDGCAVLVTATFFVSESGYAYCRTPEGPRLVPHFHD